MGVAAFIISIFALLASGWAALSARNVAKAELGRDHRDLAPEPSGRFEWVHQPGQLGGTWCYVFTVPRTYRLAADIVDKNGNRTRVTASDPLEVGYEQRVPLGEAVQLLDEVAFVDLYFFPPKSGDPGGKWSCPCGQIQKPTSGSLGHWVVRIPAERPSGPRLDGSIAK